MKAGLLRHRIDFEEYTNAQSPTTGEVTKTWVAVYTNVAAGYEPLSVRELLLSDSMRNTVVARFVVRWRSEYNDKMRINFRGAIYNIEGLQPDKESGVDYLTIPCSAGASEEGA